MNNRILKERKFWDAIAMKYDNNRKKLRNNRAYELLVKKIQENASDMGNLLDVATGTGSIPLLLSSTVSVITAVDVSTEMLRIAKEKAIEQAVNNINFRYGDICNLDFEDNSFDTIIASNILHLLFEPKVALNEISRVIKPNGKLIIPTYCHGQNIKSLMYYQLMRLTGFRAHSCWSVNSFRMFIENNGFEVITHETIKGVIPIVYLIAKPINNSHQLKAKHNNHI